MIKSLALSTAILISLPFAAEAGSLENLERERAVTIQTLLDPSLDLENRHARLESQRHRLIDLERMIDELVEEILPVVANRLRVRIRKLIEENKL